MPKQTLPSMYALVFEALRVEDPYMRVVCSGILLSRVYYRSPDIAVANVMPLHS